MSMKDIPGLVSHEQGCQRRRNLEQVHRNRDARGDLKSGISESRMLEKRIVGAGSQDWGCQRRFQERHPTCRDARGRDPRNRNTRIRDARGEDHRSRVPGAGKALGSPVPTVLRAAVAPLLRTRLGWGPPWQEAMLAGLRCCGDGPFVPERLDHLCGFGRAVLGGLRYLSERFSFDSLRFRLICLDPSRVGLGRVHPPVGKPGGTGAAHIAGSSVPYRERDVPNQGNGGPGAMLPCPVQPAPLTKSALLGPWAGWAMFGLGTPRRAPARGWDPRGLPRHPLSSKQAPQPPHGDILSMHTFPVAIHGDTRYLDTLTASKRLPNHA